MSFFDDVSSGVAHAGDAIGRGVQDAGKSVLGDEIARNIGGVSQGLVAPVADPNFKWDWSHIRDWGELSTGLSVSGGMAGLAGPEFTKKVGGAAALAGAAIYGGSLYGGAGAAGETAPLTAQQEMLAMQEMTPQQAMLYEQSGMQGAGLAGDSTLGVTGGGSAVTGANAVANTAGQGGIPYGKIANTLGMAGLAYQAGKGGQKDYGAQYAGIGKPATDVGTALIEKYNKGQLDPGDQYNIDQWSNSNIAAVKDAAARSGTSDSTMINQQVSQIQAQASSMKSSALNSMVQRGLSALQIGMGPQQAAIEAQIAQDQSIQSAQTAFFQTMAMWGAS